MSQTAFKTQSSLRIVWNFMSVTTGCFFYIAYAKAGCSAWWKYQSVFFLFPCNFDLLKIRFIVLNYAFVIIFGSELNVTSKVWWHVVPTPTPLWQSTMDLDISPISGIISTKSFSSYNCIYSFAKLPLRVQVEGIPSFVFYCHL